MLPTLVAITTGRRAFNVLCGVVRMEDRMHDDYIKGGTGNNKTMIRKFYNE